MLNSQSTSNARFFSYATPDGCVGAADQKFSYKPYQYLTDPKVYLLLNFVI
jgi:hypothetical protein